MNTQTGQHGHNPAMLAALQQQQQQQQHAHGQMNPAMMNGMHAMNGMGNMNATQQQQFQQMLAAKYQSANMAMGGMAAAGAGGAAGALNAQMMQQYQQHQQQLQAAGGGSMGVNPQALMNMGGGMNMNMGIGGGMNGRGNVGTAAGFNPQMFSSQSQAQFNQASGRPGTDGGMGNINLQMLMQQHTGGGGMGGPSGMNASHLSNGGMSSMVGMNNMSNGMMGMGGGGMGMGGMGSINPQALSMGVNTASSPQPPHSQPTGINLAALNAPGTPSNASANMGMGMGGMGGGGMPNMSNLQLTPQQMQQIGQLNPQDRRGAMQKLMLMNFQQQQQQQQREMQMRRSSSDMSMHGQLDNRLQGINIGAGMGMQGQSQRDQMQGQGMDGIMGGISGNMAAGMGGGMSGMNNGGMMSMDNINMSGMGGMQGMGGAMSGMQGMGGMQGMNAAQLQQMQLLQSQHGGPGDRPPSSMSQAGQHASPTQPHAAFPNQGQQPQAPSPARTHTPHQPQNTHAQHQHLQQQHHLGGGMMPPPTSIPPRPPTAPRPGTAGGMSGAMGPPGQFGQHPQHAGQQQQYSNNQGGSRPATAGTSPAAGIARAGSSMGMQPHQGPQQGQQQQQQPSHQGISAPSPIPIQPRPVQPHANTGGSPAPTPRPGTSQGMHGGPQGGLRAITPAMVGSRPGTATGFRQQSQPPGTPQAGMSSPTHPQQPQAHTPISTPTSATYPPIAPAPAAGSTPGSPRVGAKRKVSAPPSGGTPVPEQMQPGMPAPGTNMTPAQLASLRMGPGGLTSIPGPSGGTMRPPVLARGQQPGGEVGANGVSANGLRQTSAGPPNAANLSINTNMAQATPEPGLVDPAAPRTPRQASQPPPGSAERKGTVPGGGAPTAGEGATQVIPQLPPLPAGVSLNPKVTRVSVVPLVDSETAIRALEPAEIARMQEWMRADREYEARYKSMRERMQDEVRECIVKRKAWYEKDPMEDPRAVRRRKDKFELVGMKGGRDERMRRKVGRREGFKLPRTVDAEEASRPEQLVPIRLEFDVDHQKMRDTFVWNLNDPVITPEIFAQSIVDDYNLAPSYHSVVTKAIQDQLSDYKAHSATFGEDGFDDTVLKGQIDDQDARWWDAWKSHARSDAVRRQRGEARSRKRRKIVKDELEEPTEVPAASTLDAYMSVDEFEEDESKAVEEMRILIKLDIIVGPLKLEDQFEWDIDSPDPSPEHFADVYAKELGLGGEFRTAIAHSIREQVQIYQKSLFLVGHPSDGSAVQDEDLRLSFLPSLYTGARSMDQVVAFTPRLEYLSDGELERNEKERERELNRRRRKTTRGRRGVALPDREPPKTFRTPAIGFPEVDPATLALVAANAAPTSRRAAAAAASLTIANMVASENGTSLSPQTMPTPVPISAAPQPAAAKEKKPKGLIKAPYYDQRVVLRPRSKVAAPTPSTAADPATAPPPLDIDPPVSVAPAENKGARVPLSAKRAKELEREAKEKEYVDGQHANIIDGIWHCSNCGCPESIAVGRRKGPLGDKSQCGTCGKFWHRHRRPRPVEYNSSLEYHMKLKREEEQAKIAASRRKRPQAHNTEAPSSKAPTAEPETPRRPVPELPDEKPTSRVAPQTPRVPKVEKSEPPGSPMSTTSSTSEPPLAQRKPNGAGPATPSALGMAPSQSESTESIQDTPQDESASLPVTTPTSAGGSRTGPRPNRDQPAWLQAAMKDLNEKYPDDKLEAVLRRGPNPAQPEWRIKCTDCPGKLYTPGPGETLINYEVHLKNRQHRQKVNARLKGEPSQL